MPLVAPLYVYSWITRYISGYRQALDTWAKRLLSSTSRHSTPIPVAYLRYAESTLQGALGGYVLNITKDIQTLTSFRRQSGDFMKRIRKTKQPMVLTVRGKAAAVVLDAEAYQRLLDIAAGTDAEEGIRQGLEEAKRGKGRPAREFFAEFEAAHGISR